MKDKFAKFFFEVTQSSQKNTQTEDFDGNVEEKVQTKVVTVEDVQNFFSELNENRK